MPKVLRGIDKAPHGRKNAKLSINCPKPERTYMKKWTLQTSSKELEHTYLAHTRL